MLLAGMLTGVLFLPEPEPAEPVAVSQRSPAAVPEAPAPRAVVPLHRVDYPFHPRLGGMPLLVHSEREAPSYPLVVDSLLKGLQRTSAAP
jgi:hypothetical protein